MPNNRSKNPADWSARHLEKKAEAGDARAIKFSRDAVAGMREAIVPAIGQYREQMDAQIERVVPGFTARTGHARDRGIAEFCATLAKHAGISIEDVDGFTLAQIAGMVDAVVGGKTIARPPAENKVFKPVAWFDDQYSLDPGQKWGPILAGLYRRKKIARSGNAKPFKYSALDVHGERPDLIPDKPR